jgi:hypothetical protein
MKHAHGPAVVLALALYGIGAAGEVSTNGTGGGAWSDPATWKGKALPKPEDDVVIRKGDAVDYDRNDDGKVTCQKLLIDPKGALIFKTGMGPLSIGVGDIIESYGIIKIDGRKSPKDSFEVRLVGDTPDKRGIKLMKGSALVLWGNLASAEGRRNIAFLSPRGGPKHEDMLAPMEAGTGTLLDIQRTDFANVHLFAKDIDNTDSKPNEKLNIVGNRFTVRSPRPAGAGVVYLEACDTPKVAQNTFECVADTPLANMVGLRLGSSPLAEVSGNTFLGGFHYGIIAAHQDTSTFTGNTIGNCLFGLHLWYGTNNIVKQTTVRRCDVGLNLFHTATLSAEETVLSGCKTAVDCSFSTAQLTSLEVRDAPKDSVAVQVTTSGELTLINCNLKPEQVKTVTLDGKGDKPLVTALQYLIVAVKDAPERAVVDVRTSKPALVLKPGAMDPNVTNAPAELFEGRTPLPQTLMPLLLKGWSVGLDGKVVPAPEYTLSVLEPGGVKTVKTKTVQPQDSWYRPKPDDPTPTLEVSLK